MLKIYTASKLDSAPLWRRLRDEWTEFEFTARWPRFHVDEHGTPLWPGDSAHSAIFWQHDVEDVTKADVVLCFGEPNEILRGALVEAGIALGQGKKVIVVGENPSYGTWQYHPSVFRVKNLAQARSFLQLLSLECV